MTAPVQSPCVNLCQMDPATGWCHGCRRTLDEIATWGRLDDAAKTRVLQYLPARHAAAVAAAVNLPPAAAAKPA